MPDNATQNEPPMATLEPVPPPGNQRSLRRSRFAIGLLLAVIAVLVVLLLRPTKLDVYKTIAELEFADPALAACVQQMARDNGWTDVGHIVSLRCNHPTGEPVRNLAGIEHLVALTDVNLAFNAIKTAEPLAELPRLAVVDLSHNRLDNLPVFRAAGVLRRLELNYNNFETLEWLSTQHFAVLESLSVAHNHLDALGALTAVPTLVELNVRNNRLTGIDPIPTLVHLQFLDAGSNSIDSIEGVGELAEMRRLFLDRNRLVTAGGVESLEQLEELDLSDNPLEEVAGLASLQRLQRLELSRTGITDLDGVLALGDLEVLRLHGDVGLSCDAIRAAIEELGAAAVRYDKDCSGGS